MRVLGCKVPDDIYNEFNSLGPSISDNLRMAIYHYLHLMEKNSSKTVNQRKSPVNHRVNRVNHEGNDQRYFQKNSDFSKQTQHHHLQRIMRQKSLKSQMGRHGRASRELWNEKETSWLSIHQRCPNCRRSIRRVQKQNLTVFTPCPHCNNQVLLKTGLKL